MQYNVSSYLKHVIGSIKPKYLRTNMRFPDRFWFISPSIRYFCTYIVVIKEVLILKDYIPLNQHRKYRNGYFGKHFDFSL